MTSLERIVCGAVFVTFTTAIVSELGKIRLAYKQATGISQPRVDDCIIFANVATIGFEAAGKGESLYRSVVFNRVRDPVNWSQFLPPLHRRIQFTRIGKDLFFVNVDE